MRCRFGSARPLVGELGDRGSGWDRDASCVVWRQTQGRCLWSSVSFFALSELQAKSEGPRGPQAMLTSHWSRPTGPSCSIRCHRSFGYCRQARPLCLGRSVSPRSTVVAAGVIAALTTLACIQLRDWYDPPPVEPGPVSGLSLAVSDSVIEVSWNAPAETDTRGFGYDINWKLASEAWGGASSEVRKIPGSTTSYRISGLVNGEAYSVQVTARNDGGESAAVTGTATPTSTTSTTTPTTTATVPPTPTTTTAVSPSSLPVVTVVPEYDRANYRLGYFYYIEAVPSSCTPWLDWQVQPTLALVVALCPR